MAVFAPLKVVVFVVNVTFDVAFVLSCPPIVCAPEPPVNTPETTKVDAFVLPEANDIVPALQSRVAPFEMVVIPLTVRFAELVPSHEEKLPAVTFNVVQVRAGVTPE